jgi:hypothetical protein
MDITLAILSILWAWICFFVIPFGLPGNWLMAASALLLTHGENSVYTPLIILLVAAAVAEVFEALLGSKMALNAGAGKAGMIGSFLGALFGGFLLTFLVPVPIVGTVIGACLGAFLGAVMLELAFAQKDSASKSLVNIGFSAAVGVLLGRLVKVSFGAAGAIYWTITVINTAFSK